MSNREWFELRVIMALTFVAEGVNKGRRIIVGLEVSIGFEGALRRWRLYYDFIEYWPWLWFWFWCRAIVGIRRWFGSCACVSKEMSRES